MSERDWSNIIAARFKRHGGDGEFTKVITEQNKPLYTNILTQLKENEKGVIIYFKDDNEWTILTNKRLIVKPAPDETQYTVEDMERTTMLSRKFIPKPDSNDAQYEIPLASLGGVEPAYLLERAVGSLTNLSRILLTDNEGNTYVLRVEGKAFPGMIQALYLCSTHM